MTTKEWYAAHREQINDYSQDYYARNKEVLREKHRAWGMANAEKRSAQAKAWREKNPERVAEHNARRRAMRAARHAGAQVLRIPAAKLAEKEAYWGYCCWICRQPFDNDQHSKQWDHVKPVAKGGGHLLANLRPAGKSCNKRKFARWPI